MQSVAGYANKISFNRMDAVPAQGGFYIFYATKESGFFQYIRKYTRSYLQQTVAPLMNVIPAKAGIHFTLFFFSYILGADSY
jgi:hypothetical protein